MYVNFISYAFKINFNEKIYKMVIEKYLTYVYRTAFILLKTYLKNKT